LQDGFIVNDETEEVVAAATSDHEITIFHAVEDESDVGIRRSRRQRGKPTACKAKADAFEKLKKRRAGVLSDSDSD
jgi:hypothetical protein